MIYAFRFCACLAALLALSTSVHAQQEVRLKSGGVLVGSATIDGASIFRIFWQINLPLTTAALTVLAVFTITTVWNDFLWPLIMLRDDEFKTLTLGLASFRGGTQSYTYWSQLMAAATMSVAPLIAVFVFAQRYFVEGIALTGSTGR